MKFRLPIFVSVLVASAAFAAGVPEPGSSPRPGAVLERKTLKLGTVEFEAPANMSTFNVKGKANTLDGYVIFEGQKINQLLVKIPVESLTTGMSLRDKHMREKIFQTTDGKLPDVVLTAVSVVCTPDGADTVCPLDGELEIRGMKRPFISKIRLSSDGSRRKASGQGVVKLSDYGIPQPEQLGVKVSNEVKLNLELLVD